MAINPVDIYETLCKLGQEWSELDAAASLLEKGEKPMLSKLGDESGDKSQAAKEAAAYRHPDYMAWVKSMIEARKEANIAKYNLRAYETRVELYRTQSANERAANRVAT